jgi:hypothetical protein
MDLNDFNVTLTAADGTHNEGRSLKKIEIQYK